MSIKYFRFSGHYLYADSLKCQCRLNQLFCVLLEERCLPGTGKNSSLLGCREEQRKDGQVPRKCLGTCLKPFSNIWPIGTECLTILQERTNYF